MIQIWNQWIAEGHIERYVESKRPRNYRYIVRSTLQNRTDTKRIIGQEMDILQRAQCRPIRCDDVCSSVEYQHGDH